jgi:hypothetical protein
VAHVGGDDMGQQGGVVQPAGWIDEVDHSQEAFGHRGVVGGRDQGGFDDLTTQSLLY